MNSKINLQYTTITTPLPDFIYEDLRQYSQNANGYKPQPAELIEKLANTHNIPKEMIYLTAGADEAIQMFALAYGKNTFIFTPTYTVYNDTTDFFANVNKINALKNNEYVISTEKLPEASLIFIANPNNPFGFTSKEKILELVENNPQAIIVVDEVYAEFGDFSVIDKVKDFPNLVVIRSFSKSYCMAANRVGFIVANPDIISKVRFKTQWANVSYLSVGAVMTALDHVEYFQQLRQGIIERRDRFGAFLREHGFTVLPSKINAVLLKFEDESQGTRFAQHLVDNNFVISHGNGSSNVGLDKSFVRISIGTEEEMNALKTTVEKYR